MPLRSIVADPEDLALLTAAFDTAWKEINRSSVVDPAMVAAARQRLGYIIVGLWKNDPTQELAERATAIYMSAAEVELPTPSDLT